MNKLLAIIVAGVFATLAFNTFAAEEAKAPEKPAAEMKHHKKHHKEHHKHTEHKDSGAAGTEKK